MVEEGNVVESGPVTLKPRRRRKRRVTLKVRRTWMSPEDIQSRYEEHLRRVNKGGK